MWRHENWTFYKSDSAEPVAHGQLDAPQQYQEQVSDSVPQLEERRLAGASAWQQQEMPQPQSRTREEQFLAVQDEQLGVLETTVGNLKSIGLQIGEEVDDHQQLLGELDTRVELTQGALNRNVVLLKNVVDRQSTTCLCFTVVFLFLILLLLLLLAY